MHFLLLINYLSTIFIFIYIFDNLKNWGIYGVEELLVWPWVGIIAVGLVVLEFLRRERSLPLQLLIFFILEEVVGEYTVWCSFSSSWISNVVHAIVIQNIGYHVIDDGVGLLPDALVRELALPPNFSFGVLRYGIKSSKGIRDFLLRHILTRLEVTILT